jgi:hypothetical protein
LVILADRGFGRAEGAAVGQERGFGSRVRIKAAGTVSGAWDRGVLSQEPVRKGLGHGRHEVRDRY